MSSVKRKWYPSGPRIESTSSENIGYTKVIAPNPDPANYEIIKAEEVGTFLILKINYPGCTTFEGNKILVFKDTKPLDLLQQKLIDPHFFEDKKIKSPICRFVPTEQGWDMAIRFAKAESNV